MAKQTVEESLPLEVGAFARTGYLDPGSRGMCTWKRAGREAGELLFDAGPDRLFLIYDLHGQDVDQVVHRAYPVALERTPNRFGGERVWFLCPACRTRARKLYLPPGRTYFLCRTCHDLSYVSRQKRRSALEKSLARIDALSATLKESRMDSRRWRLLYMETEEAIATFRETDFLADIRRPLERLGLGKAVVELARVKRGRGRPKMKRPYLRRAPFARGDKHTDLESLCLRCRDYRAMMDPVPVALPNGRPAFKGCCPVCGAGMCRIIKPETLTRDPKT